MAPRDDRDQRKKLPPPESVRAQTASEPTWDQNTPVDARDPVSVLESRASRAAHNSKLAAHNSKAAATSVELLRTEVAGTREDVKAYVERDQIDHDRLFAQIGRLDHKIETMGSSVSDVREKVGTLGGRFDKVDTLVEMLTDERKVRNDAAVEVEKHERLAETEVEKQERLAGIAERRETAAFQRKRKLKILGWIGSLIGLAGTVAGLIHCG